MIVVTIEGVDRTSLIESLTITDNINNRVDIADFTITKTPSDTYVPALNDEIIITRDGDRIFGGVITSLSDKLVGPTTLRYDVSCTDYTFFLNRKLVTQRYENQTIAAIIDDLVTTYAPDFTTNGVVADIEVASIAFNRITMSDAIAKLADLVNFQWYVDYDQDIHFFATDTEPAPFAATEGNYIRESLSITKDISQLRNRVIVQGGDIPDATRTVNLAGNGVTAEFGTQFKFATKPTVTVGGVAQTVGVEYLDDETLFDCMWSFNEKYVRFTAGNIPPAPTSPAVTNIAITGEPLFPIIVNVPEPFSISLYGEYEFALEDNNISTEDQAIERALAELRAYASSIAEGSFETYRSGLRSGQIIRITDSLRGLDEDFVIQRVRYRFLSLDSTYDGIWDVTVATLKTVGVISVLQKLLLNERLTVDEQVSLVTYLRVGSDSLGTSDAISPVTTQTGPYVISYISNSRFAKQPPFTAATTTFQRWIDGTAAGSASNSNWRWAIVPTGTLTASARFETIADRNCITLAASALDKSGGTVDIAHIANVVQYPASTLTLPQLATAMPVVAGQTYNFSMDYYLQSVSNAAQVTSNMRITWYNSAGSRLGISEVAAINNSILSAWTTVTGSAVAPAGAVFAVVGPSIFVSGPDGSGRAMTCSYTNISVLKPGETLAICGFSKYA